MVAVISAHKALLSQATYAYEMRNLAGLALSSDPILDFLNAYEIPKYTFFNSKTAFLIEFMGFH